MPLILTRLNPYINRAPKLIFLSAEMTKFNYQYRQNTTTVDQMYAFWQAFLGIYYRILHKNHSGITIISGMKMKRFSSTTLKPFGIEDKL